MLEKDFLLKLYRAVGQEDYDRDSIKKRFDKFKTYMRQRFKFNCPIIIVGGTNGKGEVARNLSQLAKQNNIKAAVWTSPHIESVVERYEFARKFIELNKLQELTYKELEEAPFTFSIFELLFVTFCEWAKSLDLELLILEVGLGGRLDATNVFDADVSVITSVSRDHTQYLGNSYLSILTEKFQITRPDGFFVGQSPLRYIREKMVNMANELGCSYEILDQKDMNFQQINAEIAKTAFKNIFADADLHIDSKNRVESFQNIVEFNGAHNTDGMRQLMKSLCKNPGEKRELILAFSKRPIQEVSQLLKIVKKFKNLFTKISMTSFEHPRALGSNESRQLAEEYDIFWVENWNNKLNENIQDNQSILVAGSYYFVGEAKLHLGPN